MIDARTCRLALAILFLACSDKSDPPPPECGRGVACECQPGDPGCKPCQDGYRTALVGSHCVPTCTAPDMDCGEHGECEESAEGAHCRCDPGHTGPTCSICESGLSPNSAGQCVAAAPSHGLLTLSSIDNQLVLGTLVPPSWAFAPLVPIESDVTDIAYHSATEDVYALGNGRLLNLDLTTGTAVALTSAEFELGNTLCLDEAGRRAFTASADTLYEVNLDSFEVSTLGSFGARALEYDAQRGVLIGVDTTGATFELADSGPLSVGQAPELASLAMAFDSAVGRAYFAGTQAETDDARLLRYCQSALTRLGAIPAWQTQLVSDAPAGAAAPYTLDYQGAEPALVAANLGDTGVSVIQVTAAHPDAAVCIVAEGAESGPSSGLELELTAEARASFILLVAPARSVSLDMTAVPADQSFNVIVYSNELTVSGPSAGVSDYDDEAWGGLGLTTFSEFAARPIWQLVLMDWASQASLPLELEQPLSTAALSWVGEVP